MTSNLETMDWVRHNESGDVWQVLADSGDGTVTYHIPMDEHEFVGGGSKYVTKIFYRPYNDALEFKQNMGRVLCRNMPGMSAEHLEYWAVNHIVPTGVFVGRLHQSWEMLCECYVWEDSGTPVGVEEPANPKGGDASEA